MTFSSATEGFNDILPETNLSSYKTRGKLCECTATEKFELPCTITRCVTAGIRRPSILKFEMKDKAKLRLLDQYRAIIELVV